MSRLLNIFVLQSCFLVPFAAATIRRYSKVQSPSVRYTDILEHHFSTPRVQCVALCDATDGCSSVNHNSDTDRCELTTHIPRVQTPSSITEPNWRVYYHDPLVRGINAWQSSTYEHDGYLYGFGAELAIDGNRENTEGPSLSCAHTASGYSNWTMEFERVTEVSYVTIYFRKLLVLNYKNQNLRLLISATRQDSDNGVGKDCATFIGPPSNPAVPTKIICTPHVAGKFLKIIHNYPDVLTLCEVEVYFV